MEFLTSGRDEILNAVLEKLSSLIAAAETIKREEQNFHRFAEHMIHVRELLQKLQSHQPSIDSARLLRRMEAEVNKARQLIDTYKSKKSRRFISGSVVAKLNQSSKEIHTVLQLLPLAQINTVLNINDTADAIIRGMESMQLEISSNTDAILSTLDRHISENGGSHQQTSHGLFAFARSKGTSSSSVCPLPAQIEARESEGRRSEVDSYQQPPPTSFFLCPLTREVMEDPVSVPCGYSFERKAIEEYFHSGQKICPHCSKELSSTGRLQLTSNSTLRNYISEWKRREEQSIAERNAKKKITEAAAKLNLDNTETANKALGDLHDLMMDAPSCITAATETSCKLIPKLAELLKKNSSDNASTVLKCLLQIARFSDENKEIIGRRGVIKCLLEQSMGEPNAVAVAVLLELSRNKVVAGKIGGMSYSIPILISLLDHPSSTVAEMAAAVLENLSSIDISSAAVIAKFGYFTPFLEQFNSQELPDETRAQMAEELSQIKLTATSAKKLDNERLITHLTQMLSSDLPSTKMASLNTIKQFITFDELKTRFLHDESAIPALLRLLKSNSTAEESKQTALEILVSLIQTTPPSNPAFETLFSPEGVRDVISHIETSAPDAQISPLRLLLAIVRSSNPAAEWIVSDRDAMSYLFSAINTERNSKVKINALKVISSIAEDHHMVLPIPSSPPKESIVHTLVTILAENQVDEDPSSSSSSSSAAAAAILVHLAPDDGRINELLQSPASLNSIRALILPSSNPHDSSSENALGVLLRCVNQSSSNLQFQKRVGELLRADLVRILSAGSPLARRRAAVILSHLSRRIAGSSPPPPLALRRVLAYARRPAREGGGCPLHKPSCSPERLVCLVMDEAVEPLIEMVRTVEAGAAGAALAALDTLFGPGCDADGAAAAVVEGRGAAAILEALERGELAVREKALELFGKIRAHPGISEKELDRFKGLVLNMVRNGGALKIKAENLMKHLLV